MRFIVAPATVRAVLLMAINASQPLPLITSFCSTTHSTLESYTTAGVLASRAENVCCLWLLLRATMRSFVHTGPDIAEQAM
jgi:hypothetical protein